MMLQKLRTLMIRTPLGFVLAVVFLMTSCSRGQLSKGSTLSQLAVSSDKITGENLFRAVFFLDGPLGPALKDYSQFSTANIAGGESALQKVRDLQNRVISYLSNQDASFFPQFKTAITSGNYAIVKAQLNSGVTRYLAALQSITGENLANFKPSAVTAEFQHQYGDPNQYSKAENARNIQAFTAQKVASAKGALSAAPRPVADSVNKGLVSSTTTVYVQYYFWVYLAAAAAAAVILFLVLGVTDQEGSVSTSLLSKNDSYLKEDYISTITINMAN